MVSKKSSSELWSPWLWRRSPDSNGFQVFGISSRYILPCIKAQKAISRIVKNQKLTMVCKQPRSIAFHEQDGAILGFSKLWTLVSCQPLDMKLLAHDEWLANKCFCWWSCLLQHVFALLPHERLFLGNGKGSWQSWAMRLSIPWYFMVLNAEWSWMVGFGWKWKVLFSSAHSSWHTIHIQ